MGREAKSKLPASALDALAEVERVARALYDGPARCALVHESGELRCAVLDRCRPPRRSTPASIAPVSPIARARPLAMNGKRPVLIARPSAFNDCSVAPAHAISGQV